VESALRQTYENIEVIVVIDGPDEATVRALEEVKDKRLRLIPLTRNVGGAEARNIGVRAAKGEWIALLDDDDEWLPQKTAKQTAAALKSGDKNILVSCKFLARTTKGDTVCPARIPASTEPIDEYMCCPKGYRQGEGFLQTSTYLVSRELILRVPFLSGLRRGQDFVWMMEVCKIGGAHIYVHPDVLSIFTAGGAAADPGRISSNPKWRDLYDWIRNNRNLFTPRTYAYCLTTIILPDVIACSEPFSVRLALAAEAFFRGFPTPKSLFLFAVRGFFPQSVIDSVKKLLRVKFLFE
jgi:glycosyltransferase involved in cell wall biosynthesis